VDSIDFAYLANCFYVHCSSLTAEKFYSVFRILEAVDYFFTKELNDAISFPDATTHFLKSFACAFGVFDALQNSIAGDTAIKIMCLLPFLSVIFMRTNAKSKGLSENGQKQLYSALYYAMESFEVVESIANFSSESNQLQLMAEYRKALHCIDANLTDTDSSRYLTKKYDGFITRLTSCIDASSGNHVTQQFADSTFLTTTRSFLSRKYDGLVHFVFFLCNSSFTGHTIGNMLINTFSLFIIYNLFSKQTLRNACCSFIGQSRSIK
jgi:hypothetical protein